MSTKKSPWICRFHFYKPADEVDADGKPNPTPEKIYEALASVWTDDIKDCNARLKEHLEPQGYELIWVNTVMPVKDWLRKHGHDYKAINLANSVNADNQVSMSEAVLQGAEAGANEDEGFLRIEETELDELPDQAGVPFWEKEWITEQLKEILFGQKDEEETLRTYFIADATLRKNITGVFDLDMLDVPVRCLFEKGEAEELKEAAPYLIDMTLPEGAYTDKDLAPKFHKEFFADSGHMGTGIFIRTKATIQNVWNHLSRLTKVKNENGRDVYFRFWDKEIFLFFWERQKYELDKVIRFFTPSDFDSLTIITVIVKDSLAYLTSTVPTNVEDNVYDKSKLFPVVIDKKEMDILREYSEGKFINSVRESLIEKLPHTDNEVVERVDGVVPGVMRYLKNQSSGNPVNFRDCFTLSFLALLLGSEINSLLKSPLLNDALIPISQRVGLAQEWYLETLKQNTIHRRI